jgi:hypothetical protein
VVLNCRGDALNVLLGAAERAVVVLCTKLAAGARRRLARGAVLKTEAVLWSFIAIL